MPNSYIRLIFEKNVPYVAGLLDQYATIRYLSADEITAAAVRECDGMIIRTRTRCDSDLLAKSEMKLIATATIGTDHIDMPYCASRGITAVNAPGCNAPAVAQYVVAAMYQLINRPLSSYTLGIVGVGHVGSIVERWAKGLGMNVLLCDPLRQQAEGGDKWCGLDTIARRADIITFHTPLTADGAFPTFHMADDTFFAACRRAPIIINTARGAVADTRSLIDARRAGLVSAMAIDCWENEPDIDKELLRMADIATPHIAGYSEEGKIRASQTVIDAVTTFFMLPRVTLDAPMPPAPATIVDMEGILSSCPLMPLTEQLKAHPDQFEALRNSYPLRHEAPQGRLSD